MKTETTVSGGEIRDGIADGGGINFRMFAKDGEESYSGQRPTWAFPLSVHLARPLQTCWHIHLPFRLTSITVTEIATSPQKTKREQSLLSNITIAYVVSALSCPLRAYRSSSWPWMTNIQFWNT